MRYILIQESADIDMALESEERSATQLIISFFIGAGVSVFTAIIFGTDSSLVISVYSIPMPLVGLGISVAISIALAISAGRIRSNRLVGSIGHVLLYSILTSILQNLVF